MKLLWLALALLPAAAHAAGIVSCPDLSSAVQVATCPSEAELRYTFSGYCADAARMYDKDPACADEKVYRQKKNVALWESRDVSFQGYVSCDLSPASVRDAKAARIAVTRVGNLNRIACTYRHGIVFTQRTRAACKVAGDATVRPVTARRVAIEPVRTAGLRSSTAVAGRRYRERCDASP